MASMMILGLGICASSSSVSSVLGGGGAFAFIKKRQADAAAAAEAKRKAEAAAAAKRRAAAARRAREAAAARRAREAAAARRRAAAARRQAERRRREQAAARQRAIAARAKRIRRKPKLRKIGRRFKRAFRRIRKPKLRRIGRRFKRAFRRRRRRGGKTGRRRRRGGKTGRRRGRRCFSPETPIKLLDGNTVPIKDLKLGDVLTNGSIVNATMQIRNEGDKYYRIHSKELDTDILVTGSHYIRDSNKYVRVQNFKESRSTDIVDTVVSCVITNNHRIPVGEYIFWDWEDQKVNL
jgi:hypothetical protein